MRLGAQSTAFAANQADEPNEMAQNDCGKANCAAGNEETHYPRRTSRD
jgi:hypothetical protein